MDLGLLTMESTISNEKSLGSIMHLKQVRSADEEPWKASKILKPTNDFDVNNNNSNKKSLLRSASMVCGDDGQTMLCFSSSSANSKPQQEFSFVCSDGASRYQDFPIFQAQQTPFFAKGNVMARSQEGVYGGLNRFRGPFTPSQWMELEHQALIYKHIVANVPIPSNLLIAVKKSLNPFAFSSLLSAGSYVPNSFGWGSFHLGFSGNTDPEPGRCRRTDGKKWRCSRDAVPDQKYCERHINRGRHRSRKPVEGQTGHAVSGSTASKVAPIAPSAALAMSSGRASNASAATNPSTDHLINGIQDPNGFSSTITTTVNLKSKDSSLSGEKHRVTNQSTQPDFGLVSSDSLLNPSQTSFFLNSKTSASLMSFTDQETHNQHTFRHDNWPKDHHSDRGSVAWPGELKSDWTQLSMSIPMTPSEFSSSTNSPEPKKLTLSPLRLAGEFDPIQMGLSVCNDSCEPIQKQTQTHWLPVSWGSSMGGPLGEVLNGTSSSAGGTKSTSGLNLITEGWESSPPLGASPTGVLQKSTFASLSNSSAGSSPRYDTNKALEAANFSDDVLGSTIASSSCIRSL